MSSKTNSKCY